MFFFFFLKNEEFSDTVWMLGIIKQRLYSDKALLYSNILLTNPQCARILWVFFCCVFGLKILGIYSIKTICVFINDGSHMAVQQAGLCGRFVQI